MVQAGCLNRVQPGGPGREGGKVARAMDVERRWEPKPSRRDGRLCTLHAGEAFHPRSSSTPHPTPSPQVLPTCHSDCRVPHSVHHALGQRRPAAVALAGADTHDVVRRKLVRRQRLGAPTLRREAQPTQQAHADGKRQP